jgi:hypothetical protein
MEVAVQDRIAFSNHIAMEVEREPLSVNAELGYRGEGFGEFRCNALSV